MHYKLSILIEKKKKRGNQIKRRNKHNRKLPREAITTMKTAQIDQTFDKFSKEYFANFHLELTPDHEFQ